MYYLSGECLFRLNKQTEETEAMSKVNGLSDISISNIYHNSDKDYLVVVYGNSNVDVILSDGTVMNMPEVMDDPMTPNKPINDVTFAPGLIYLATDFGYVVIYDNSFVVKESHHYEGSLTTVAQVGNMLLLSTNTDFYYGDVSADHEQFSSFSKSNLNGDCRIVPINDSTFCMISTSATIPELTRFSLTVAPVRLTRTITT